MAVAFLGTATVGCHQSSSEVSSEEPAANQWFSDVTDDVGLKFLHRTGPSPERHFMPDIMGSGAALFDFDNDGCLDIYLVQNVGPDSDHTNRLFQQEADGRFRDVTAGSGLDVRWGMGVAVGAVNNDGLPDVLVTEYTQTRLYINTGSGRFADISQQAGIDNPLWGTSASFVDYDRDGWLDFVVVNCVE